MHSLVDCLVDSLTEPLVVCFIGPVMHRPLQSLIGSFVDSFIDQFGKPLVGERFALKLNLRGSPPIACTGRALAATPAAVLNHSP